MKEHLPEEEIMTGSVDVALVMAPPFIPDEPHLGMAYLQSYLTAHGFRVGIFDFSVRLFQEADPSQRRLWDRSATVAVEWQQRKTVDWVFNENWHAFDRYLDELLATRPRVVGLSFHMTNAILSMEVINLLRHKAGKDIVIVAGGPAFFVNNTDQGYELCMYGHPTLGRPELREVMETWFATLDGIVLGEGEGPMLEICQRVREGRELKGVPNMVRVHAPGQYEPLLREPPIRDLSTIPFPTFEGWDLDRYTRRQLPTLFNRGCIKRCTCCTERYRWGKFRMRRAEEILAELKHHVEVLGIRHFNACDMLLNAHVRELEKLCDLIVAEGLQIRWGGNVVVRKEMTFERFVKMRNAGVNWLIFGIESGSPHIVDLIGKRFTLKEGERNLERCHRAGIRTYINIIIGFPGETEEDFQQTMEYVRRNRKSIDWIILMAMFEIFHHTEMAQRPEQYSLRPEDVQGLSESFGLVDWSDLTGNTYEVRQYRFARMMRLLAELGLPDPTMQGDDLRLSETLQALTEHQGVVGMSENALSIDPLLDAPLAEIMERLLDHHEPRRRAGAARVLGMMESRRSIPSLLDALHDPDEWVRGEAARALGRIADPSALNFLEALLTDEGYAGLSEDMQRNLFRLHRLFKASHLVQAFEQSHPELQSTSSDKTASDNEEVDRGSEP